MGGSKTLRFEGENLVSLSVVEGIRFKGSKDEKG